MCGIAGLFDPNGASGKEKLAGDAQAMAAALTHRGPDDAGCWADPQGRVAFGHRRLAVIDLGPDGHQPMVSADRRWVISYNGEIYNFRALSRRLASEGVSFRGGSDTEVLLGAVAQWGIERALEACEGMFALALWDRRRHELHLVRDRLGEKPLYYGWVGGRLAFASELKAVARLPEFTAELDRDSVALYLRHNCVPAPNSIYKAVAKLPPGHLLTARLSLRPGELPMPRPYWSARKAVEDARRRPLEGTDEELADRLETVLSRAVADRMVADVPVGAFLSGGVDSSMVVALMQEHSSRPVRTFTVGFADRGFDESTEAAAVAAHLGTEHTPLQLQADDACRLVGDLPEIWDEPFGDISQIPSLLVSRLARSEVTVCLSGDGGDELFAGYNRHALLEKSWRRAAVLPGPLRRAAGSVLAGLPPGVVGAAATLAGAVWPRLQVRNPVTKVAKLAKVLAASGPEDAYLSLVSHWDDPGALVRGASPPPSLALRPDRWPALGGMTEQMLWLDLVSYLPDDILPKLDRAAMAASLETRVPFLDRSVLETAWRLPMEAKLRRGTTKWLLRQVLHRRVPKALVERPKMGFGVPIGSWLRGPLRPWAEELLDERGLRNQGLLDPGPIRAAWGEHQRGRRDLGYELWDVLALEAWLDRWMPHLGK